MNNHLLGFLISGLIHAGAVGFAVNIDKEQKPTPVVKNNTMLMVSMFQEKVATPKPITPVKVAEKLITPPEKKIVQPVIPEVIPDIVPKIIPEAIKALPIAVAKAPSPAPKIEIKPIFEPKPIVKPKIKPIKAKKTKKILKKKPVKKVVKKLKKKPIPKKTTRTVRKTVKKKPVARKNVKRVVKKVQRKPQNVVRKAKPPVTKRPTRKTVRTHKQRPSTPQKKASRVAKASQKAIRQPSRSRPQTKRTTNQKTNKRVVPTSQSINLTKKYKARLQQLIATNKRYPKRAKRRNQQGRVTVSFNVTHSGNISNIKIIRSSNNSSLDNSALQAIKLSSGKLPYLPNMSKKLLNLNITLSYILK